MDLSTLSLAAMVVVTSLASAALGLMLVVRLTPRRTVNWTPFSQIGPATAFLFQDDELVDATPQARNLLATGPEQMEAWPRLKAILAPRFPQLGEALGRLGNEQKVELAGRDEGVVLRAEWRSGLTRIELDHIGETGAADTHTMAALQDELHDLRSIVDEAPLLIWKEDLDGEIRWANSAYIELALAADAEGDTLPWPLPRLFKETPWARSGAGNRAGTRGNAEGEPGTQEGPTRLTYKAPGGQEQTFEAVIEDNGRARLVFAIPADRLVRAEASRREFVQTLTKTFAHLPIGLAVFDKSRRLAVFNPALTDLTNLQPLFLSRRPTLFDVLDQLREARRMPEPKDYRSWRRRIGELEEAASTGTHIETWSLPDGTTFRVTGRPHPDGAVAFLFEDITSEVSLTRRFRSELELGQAVVDNVDEALAVFSPARELVLSNTAFDALWGISPNASLGGTNLQDAEMVWRQAAQPGPIWDALRGAATTSTPTREEWSGQAHLNDGRALRCRVAHLPGNIVLIGFTILTGAGPQRLGETPKGTARHGQDDTRIA